MTYFLMFLMFIAGHLCMRQGFRIGHYLKSTCNSFILRIGGLVFYFFTLTYTVGRMFPEYQFNSFVVGMIVTALGGVLLIEMEKNGGL